MTKAEIVTEIAKSTGIDKASVLAVVEGLMTSIKDSFGNCENVYLCGFVSFIVKERKEKIARNISKNTTVVVPAHTFRHSEPFKYSKLRSPNNMGALPFDVLKLGTTPLGVEPFLWDRLLNFDDWD